MALEHWYEQTLSHASGYRTQVHPFVVDIHDQEGVYLEFVRGCGHDAYEMTVAEALALSRQMSGADTDTAPFQLSHFTGNTTICSDGGSICIVRNGQAISYWLTPSESAAIAQHLSAAAEASRAAFAARDADEDARTAQRIGDLRQTIAQKAATAGLTSDRAEGLGTLLNAAALILHGSVQFTPGDVTAEDRGAILHIIEKVEDVLGAC